MAAAEAAFKDVPEIFEVTHLRESFNAHVFIQISAQVELGESLIARTEALGERFARISAPLPFHGSPH
jgi:hypothetical protein